MKSTAFNALLVATVMNNVTQGSTHHFKWLCGIEHHTLRALTRDYTRYLVASVPEDVYCQCHALPPCRLVYVPTTVALIRPQTNCLSCSSVKVIKVADTLSPYFTA